MIQKANVEPTAEVTATPSKLARFYYGRAIARREMGMTDGEVEDMHRAVALAEQKGGLGGTNLADLLRNAAWTELQHGNWMSAMRMMERATAKVELKRVGSYYSSLARIYAWSGDIEKAEKYREKTLNAYAGKFWPWARVHRFNTGLAIAMSAGRWAEAEELAFRTIEAFERTGDETRYPTWLEYRRRNLARIQLKLGKYNDAELTIRNALRGALRRYGTKNTASIGKLLVDFSKVLLAKGRLDDASALLEEVRKIYQTVGVPESSLLVASMRHLAGDLRLYRRKFHEALDQYDRVAAGMRDNPYAYRRFYANAPSRLVATALGGRAREALSGAREALQEAHSRLGDKHRETAFTRAAYGVVLSRLGEDLEALSAFREALPILFQRSRGSQGEDEEAAGRHFLVGIIMEEYLTLLARLGGAGLGTDGDFNPWIEAFQVAGLARMSSVTRALSSSAARAATQNPELADLARREQDAVRQISALYGQIADLTSSPEAAAGATLNTLRTRVDQIRGARAALMEEIERRFPEYANLINPKPATIDQVQAVMRPGEALIATYVGEEWTYVWAVPHSGELAFAAVDIGRKELSERIAHLRSALEPNAETLGDIPEFDVAAAYQLYERLLKPVEAGWKGAKSLLVVAHGPLGYLPLSLLPTKPVALGPDKEPLFSNYREIPWLLRSQAVTVLPSVASLRTLRGLPAGDATRKAFIGFGDPWFSTEQAAQAEREEETEVAAPAMRGLKVRGLPVKLRAVPATRELASAELARLPRLVDTADEIRQIALALNADPSESVFTGAEASEGRIKSMDLSGFRVLAFSTHGLVPGDLDGLTQPALAFSSPRVTGGDDDGLLTMGEILGLRLNADWVVLSACNTASGDGAGAEAISGLGRAFFYAGTRALLVSNWPVETTSARMLMTDLFRRQKDNPGLTRTEALRQAMLGLVDGPGYVDERSGKTVYSYAHPIFWAPFVVVGDGG
ncbi:MAG: CHAT domain-containing protein [Proteobacteria bacterium]|nr:CHAT domain-containing protein [Pseudomonadota bacterium]